MKVLDIDNVFMRVGDLTRAVEFYRDVVGPPVAEGFDAMGMALFQVGDEMPGLGAGANDTPHAGGQKIRFEVPDARTAAVEPAAHGFTPTPESFLAPTGWAFEIVDPRGNTIGFTGYTAQPHLGRGRGSPGRHPAGAEPTAGGTT